MRTQGSSVYGIIVVALAMSALLGPSCHAQITCQVITSDLMPCLNYLLHGGGDVPANCCDGVRRVAGMANTTIARQTACNCLKNATSLIQPLQPPLLTGLPGACGVQITIPVNGGIDCSQIH